MRYSCDSDDAMNLLWLSAGVLSNPICTYDDAAADEQWVQCEPGLNRLAQRLERFREAEPHQANGECKQQ